MGNSLPRNALAAFLLLPPHLQGIPSTPQSISCTLLYPTATLSTCLQPRARARGDPSAPQPELPDSPLGSLLTKLSLQISQERNHLCNCSSMNSKGFSSRFLKDKEMLCQVLPSVLLEISVLVCLPKQREKRKNKFSRRKGNREKSLSGELSWASLGKDSREPLAQGSGSLPPSARSGSALT